MLAEFSIVPVGVGSSIGDQLAEVLNIIDATRSEICRCAK